MKDLLIMQTLDAFERDPGMSLLSSLQELTQPEAEWRFNATTWTIEEILYPAASCKLAYCQQGFARWHEPIEKPFSDIQAQNKFSLRRAIVRSLQCGSLCCGAVGQ